MPLTGSPAEQLRALDAAIARLESLRRAIAGASPVVRGGFEGPSRYALAPEWPWFAAGFVVAAGIVLLATLLMRL